MISCSVKKLRARDFSNNLSSVSGAGGDDFTYAGLRFCAWRDAWADLGLCLDGAERFRPFFAIRFALRIISSRRCAADFFAAFFARDGFAVRCFFADMNTFVISGGGIGANVRSVPSSEFLESLGKFQNARFIAGTFGRAHIFFELQTFRVPAEAANRLRDDVVFG